MTHPIRPNLLHRRELLALGQTDKDIGAQHRRNEIQRVRPGCYLDTAAAVDASVETRQRLLIAATMPRLSSDAVLSHTSAALWRELAMGDVVDRRVHVSRNRPGGGFRRGNVHCHGTVIVDDETEVLRDVRVTTTARTVVDCACVSAIEIALGIADDALHRKLCSPDDLWASLGRVGRRRGIAGAKRVLELADARSESVGESRSRLALAISGVPEPVVQFKVFDENGELVARCDFAWPRWRILGEFDGRIKYGRLLRPGEDPGEVVWREKLREDDLRSRGWIVIRWTWVDLRDPARLARRILDAIARAGG